MIEINIKCIINSVTRMKIVLPKYDKRKIDKGCLLEGKASLLAKTPFEEKGFGRFVKRKPAIPVN